MKKLAISLFLAAGLVAATTLGTPPEDQPVAYAHTTGLSGNWNYCNSVCNQMPNDSSRHWYTPSGSLVCSYSIFNGCNSGNNKGFLNVCPSGFAECFSACTGNSQSGATVAGCHGYFCASGAAGQEGTCGGPSGNPGSSSNNETRCGSRGTLTFQGWGNVADCADDKGVNTNASCWCDSSCIEFGDCCADAGHCTEVTTTCESSQSCGGHNSNAACWCDQTCLKYGDCCAGGPC